MSLSGRIVVVLIGFFVAAANASAQTSDPIHVVKDGLTLGIQINSDEPCEITDPDPIFARVVGSLEAHGLGFQRETDDTTSMVFVNIRAYGTQTHGCAAFAAIELLHRVEGLRVDYSAEPYSGWLVLVAFYAPMMPLGLAGEAFHDEMAQWIGDELYGLWDQILEEQGAG